MRIHEYNETTALLHLTNIMLYGKRLKRYFYISIPSFLKILPREIQVETVILVSI